MLAHGYELGVSRHGGFTEYQRVPAGWVVPLAPGLSPRDAMSIGTAGFTAAMSVVALEERGLSPDDGPVLVTGASGGVGGTALAILADRGYEVWAATGKSDEARPAADDGCGRDPDPRRGDRRGTAARIGTLGRRGGRRRRGDAAVRAADAARSVPRSRRRGNAGGAGLETTVFPFILRGVALLGMDSVNMPIGRRRELWDRLATDLRPRDLGRHCTEVTLDTLDEALDGIVAGDARGRWIVRIGG